MQIEVGETVPAEQSDTAWQLYIAAFEELRYTAVQRHMMTREEFDTVIGDSRVRKYLAVDPDNGGRLAALSTLTNELDAMPLISPDYFQRRWPDRFAESRIWYIGFMAVHPDYRSSGVFERVIEEMYQVIAASHGIGVVDICRRNDELGLPEAIHGVLDELTGSVRRERLDEQTYWLYEFPTAA
jgi:ribosomal protein S18 acetylase RimI-like enzyme